tara:strand:+ start:546 stop:1037 length:492 start_codon:yes stop_codon:yes gene_type:complete
LLDWTSNPLVSAYFATTAEPNSVHGKLLLPSGRVSGSALPVRPDAKKVTARIVAVSVQQKYKLDPDADFLLQTNVSYFWPRSLTNRITDQNGLFTVHPHPNKNWEEPLLSERNVFDIPGEMRAFFQKRLFYLGIDQQRIMGGLDGVGSRLAWQYNARTGLGSY